MKEYFPQGCFIAKRIGTCYDVGPGLYIESEIAGELRASAEAVLTWHITDKLLDKLEQQSPTLLYTFKGNKYNEYASLLLYLIFFYIFETLNIFSDIEMRTVTLLACMELTGLGVSLKSLQDLSSIIHEEMMSLEEQAYALCGRKFNFSSSKQVGEVCKYINEMDCYSHSCLNLIAKLSIVIDFRLIQGKKD